MNDTTTVDDYTDYDFEKSGGAEVAKESSKAGDFEREIMFLSLKGDAASVAAGKNRMLLRFVTDFQKPRPDEASSKFNLPWITANEHNFLNTKPRPDWLPEKMKWSAKMTLGCRKDKIFIKKFGGACYGCDVLKAKASAKTWALGIEREEVRDESGNLIGLRDKMRKVFDRDAEGNPIVIGEENGKKKYQMKDAPAWIVMNQGWKNFFANLNGQAGYFGTILDADWLVTRTGEGADDTVYSFVRVGEQVIPPEGYVVGDIDLSAAYGGQKFDLRLPGLMETLYPDMPDLRRIIAERVRQDIIDRYFVPGWVPPAEELARYQQQGQQSGGQSSGGGAAPMMMSSNPSQPAPQGGTAEVPSDAMAALKARIAGGQGS